MFSCWILLCLHDMTKQTVKPPAGSGYYRPAQNSHFLSDSGLQRYGMVMKLFDDFFFPNHRQEVSKSFTSGVVESQIFFCQSPVKFFFDLAFVLLSLRAGAPSHWKIQWKSPPISSIPALPLCLMSIAFINALVFTIIRF